jgi:hypothetical protein
MKRRGFTALLGIIALILTVSLVSAQCGPGMPNTNPTNGSTTTHNGWGCFPNGTTTASTLNGPSGGWCGFYNNSNVGSMGMVSTQAAVMHILFPALAPNCPISQLTDWTSKPDRVDHFDLNGQTDYYFVMTYDASRNLTKVELFDAAEALIAYTECVYGASGELVKTLNYNAAGAELSYTDFIYNTTGQLVSVQTYVNGLPAYTLRCAYNQTGHISKVSQYTPAGTLQMYTKCSYNTNARLTKTVSYSAQKSALETRTYSYNSAGNMKRVSAYNNMHVLNGYTKCSRDSSGQPADTYFYNRSNTQTGHSLCYFNLP